MDMVTTFDLERQGVFLSSCLSFCSFIIFLYFDMYCFYANKLHYFDRSIILVQAPPPLQNSKANPLSVAFYYKGVEKFSKYRHLTRKRYEMGLYGTLRSHRYS